MSSITRKRGDTYPIELRLGKPIPDGATFLLTVDPKKDPKSSSTNLFQLTGTILDQQKGYVEFPVSSSAADHVGDFYYDAQMTDESGLKYTVADGKYKLNQDITK